MRPHKAGWTAEDTRPSGLFEDLCPKPPQWTVPWPEIVDAFDWVRAMAGVPQDPVHHGEGDVATHTRLVCQALAGLPEWRARPADARVRLFAAALLHDAGKPHRTQVQPDGQRGRALTLELANLTHVNSALHVYFDTGIVEVFGDTASQTESDLKLARVDTVRLHHPDRPATEGIAGWELRPRSAYT